MPVSWEGVEALPVLACNQLIAQVDANDGVPELALLTFGHVSPPPVIGSAEEQTAALKQYGSIKVQPLVRISVSPSRLRAFAKVLVGMAARFDQERTGETSK